MVEFLIKAAQLMLSLSILVVLHELGHFIPARLFKTRVEKFYLFFDAGFSLFKYKRGDTEYGIGWLPLGGYVKISGMIDESFDTEQMKSEPQPWEFRSKPAWQRLIIMLGGVTVNFILGLFIYAMILWVYGEEYIPSKNIVHGVFTIDSLGEEVGLMDGDKILKIGDKEFEIFQPGVLNAAILLDGVRDITIDRAGAEKVLTISDETAKKFDGRKDPVFNFRMPFVVKDFPKNSAAKEAGIEVDDEIIAVNGKATPFFNDFQRATIANKSKLITVMGIRNETDTMNFSVPVSDKGTIGIQAYPATRYYDSERINYTLAEAIPAGIAKGWNILVLNVQALGKIVTGKLSASNNLGGFGSIGNMFESTWNWERFWFMTAALSLILAFMNLLPIPALDGGHVMFLFYEMISGRKPSDKFLEYATMVGFVLVISLVLYANGLDLWRWITGRFS